MDWANTAMLQNTSKRTSSAGIMIFTGSKMNRDSRIPFKVLAFLTSDLGYGKVSAEPQLLTFIDITFSTFMSCNTRRDSVISGAFEVTAFTGACSKRKQAAQINSLEFRRSGEQ